MSVIEIALARTADGTLRTGFCIVILRRHFNDTEARTQLDIAIDWGRYAEIYEYDASHDEIRRELP